MPRREAIAKPKRLTPPQIAERLGVSVEKVRGWIDRGELRAINLATRADGLRPRWLVWEDDLAAFERSRSSAARARPAAAPRGRRRDAGDVIDFF